MPDLTIPTEMVADIDEVLDLVGTVKVLRILAYGAMDTANPGAGKPALTPENVDIICMFINYTDYQMKNTNIQKGDRQLAVSVKDLTSNQIAGFENDNQIVDGSDIYEIKNVDPYEVASVSVLIVLQLRK